MPILPVRGGASSTTVPTPQNRVIHTKEPNMSYKIPGINMDRVRKETRIIRGERTSGVSKREKPLNWEISQLITEKNKLKSENAPYEERKAVQDQIDVLMKKREAMRNASLFAEWRDKK